MPDRILYIMLEERGKEKQKLLEQGIAKVKFCEQCPYVIEPGVACYARPDNCPYRLEIEAVNKEGVRWDHHEFWETKSDFNAYIKSGHRIDGD